MTGMLALFFYTDKPSRSFNVYATAPTVPRAAGDEDHLVYKKFSDGAKDVIDARIYLGIHFWFADTEARSQGRRVAKLHLQERAAAARRTITRTRTK